MFLDGDHGAQLLDQARESGLKKHDETYIFTKAHKVNFSRSWEQPHHEACHDRKTLHHHHAFAFTSVKLTRKIVKIMKNEVLDFLTIQVTRGASGSF